MIESLIFLVAGIGLYFLADWVLVAIEMRLGRRLGQRSLVFFAILLASALVAFALLRALAPS